MVAAAEVNAALGTSVGGPSINKANPPVSVCTYSGGNPPQTVIVQFHDGQDAVGFGTERNGFNNQNQPTTDLSGFGDEAFTSVLSANNRTVVTLVVRKADVEVLISAPTPLPTVEALMEQILSAAAPTGGG